MGAMQSFVPERKLIMKRKSRQKPLTEQKWNAAKWRHRCAWCAALMRSDQEVLAIPIRLQPAAIEVLEPGEIAPLLLPSANKVVPMMVVGEDSPAKREGNDAMFRLCSESCAKLLQAALRTELGGAGAA